MADCREGEPCLTGTAAMQFADEEPPFVFDRFIAPFVIVLYTRSSMATLGWILIFGAVFEAIHIAQLWAGSPGMIAVGPLRPIFGVHASTGALLVSYPLLALIAVLLGLAAVTMLRSPVLLEPYLGGTSERSQEIGTSRWLGLQIKYSVQIVLVGYLPSTLAFGVLVPAPDPPGEDVLVWGLLHLALIFIFWVWNTLDYDTIWSHMDRKDAVYHHNRLFAAWALLFGVFWIVVLVLSTQRMPSHLRTVIGAAFVSAALVLLLPLYLIESRAGRWYW